MIPLKSIWAFLRRNAFLLLLVISFLAADRVIQWWDPMSASLRFYKNDFDKTLLHHEYQRSGSIFFGNSAVTGAYIEEQAQVPLVEMGLSYGKITDLKAILEQSLYQPEGQIVIGIDSHTMLDKLPTDESYPWFRDWYEPYVYFNRDYFRDTFEETTRNTLQGHPLRYEPRWSDKMLYYGQKPPEELQKKLTEYEERFGWMTVDHDLKENVDALRWVVQYGIEHNIPIKVIWMPYNKEYPYPAYWKPLRDSVDSYLEFYKVPVLDLTDKFELTDFHDIVHINRQVGAPKFTQEVDQWLQSFAKPSK
jgi:hypothetical protein